MTRRKVQQVVFDSKANLSSQNDFVAKTLASFLENPIVRAGPRAQWYAQVGSQVDDLAPFLEECLAEMFKCADEIAIVDASERDATLRDKFRALQKPTQVKLLLPSWATFSKKICDSTALLRPNIEANGFTVFHKPEMELDMLKGLLMDAVQTVVLNELRTCGDALKQFHVLCITFTLHPS